MASANIIGKKDIKIMVVDDAEFSRITMAKILSGEGYNIIGEAGSAEEAIEITNNNSPNIIIIDVVMPEVNGNDLAKKFIDNIDDVKVIMVSSLDQDHIIIESITVGAVDFLKKPFTPDILISSVNKLADEMIKDANKN